ncbi:MAG TPA: hypothetical protein VJ912_02075 [Candidatus Nanoarchaeia archaeon]|nr:hypothetical protein [Candidatus Nanoarchaeia archaeon]
MVINFLASYGSFGGGTFGNLFASLQQSGFFDYVLPFLLIFAIIHAVLMQAKIFGGNRAIGAIISLAVSLMALQFQIVPRFFEQVFPQLGIGLVVILLAVILLGVFSKDAGAEKATNWIIFGVAIIVFLVVVFNSFDWFTFGFGGSFLYGINWTPIIVGAAVIGVVIWIIMSQGKNDNSSGKTKK